MPVNSIFDNDDLSKYTCFDHAGNLPRHRWYYFKEGFSPFLVEKAMEKSKIKKDDLVVDIFSGSGTVPLVASNKNINAIGFEVNPFMTFISRTKMINMKTTTFNSYLGNITKGINRGKKSNLENYSTFCENNENEKWLFNLNVLRGFEGGWNAAKNIPSEVAKLYRLALVSAIMLNSNAVKDGKCLRYKKNWESISYSKESFCNDFLQYCKMIEDDLNNTDIPKKARIVNGDVRKILRNQNIDKFKLCITSPPYLNSFDYSDIYRPELFLCKYVTDNDTLGKLRLKTLRSHVQINWKSPSKSGFGAVYQRCYNELLERKNLLWNKKIPLMIQAYFEDIENLLIELKDKAKNGAYLWIVVSTSVYAGVEIPVDLIIADIGSKIGWELEEIINTRHMRNSTQNAQKFNAGIGDVKRLRESIIILRNQNN
jgi:DNA modification methylase